MSRVRLLCGDALERLRDLPDKCASVVITDPPYNVGKSYDVYRDDLPEDDYVAWLGGVFREARRCSEHGIVYFPGAFGAWRAREVLARAGLFPKRLLGWHKKEFAGDKWCGGPAVCWEPAVWAPEPDAAFFNTIYGHRGRDFLVVPSTHGNPWALEHPCPKPLPVMRWLVGLFCPEGGTVLDPFLGTGTTAVAAAHLGRDCVGVELSENYCKLARRRIETEAPLLADVEVE